MKQTWESENGKWGITLFESEWDGSQQLNVRERKTSMLYRIHMGVISNDGKINVQNVNKIPRYVKEKIMELAS